MKLVVQRVKEASVAVGRETVGQIGKGLLVFVAVHKDDTPEVTDWFVKKLVNLRIFPNDEGKMHLSVKDIGGGVLIISQFTLYGNCSGGRRPDFLESARGEMAEVLYEKFVQEVKQELADVQTGKFAAEMEVSLINDGPVTLIVEKA